MTHQNIPIDNRRTGWLLAAAAALVINLVLLSVLPVVNLGTVSLPKNPPVPQTVNFVRLAQPESVQPESPQQRPETVPAPDPPTMQKTDAIALTPDSLERTLRPDLQAISVHADVPRLTDIPLATVQFSAMGLDGVFDADELDKPLVGVSRMPPFYPLQARRASVEGWVEIEFLVNEQGRVEDVRIIAAEPSGVFEDSVRQAVAGWRFQPGTIMGEPVRTRVSTTIRFELEETP